MNIHGSGRIVLRVGLNGTQPLAVQDFGVSWIFFSLLQLQLPSDVNEDPTSQDSIVNLFYFSIMIIE